jgi:DTW domain-containing protein YfiP
MNEEKEKHKKFVTEKIEEFLARGGKITKCPPCTTSEEVTYKHKFGRGRKKKSED